jgi:hypothetical protein
LKGKKQPPLDTSSGGSFLQNIRYYGILNEKKPVLSPLKNYVMVWESR